jgi:tripartite ATP-independent transporter DctP family solute receptor
MKRKTFIFAVALLSITVLISPCWNSVFAKEVTLKFGHLMPESYWLGQGIIKFAEQVDKKTNGTLKINIFPAGQLGGERSMLEQIQTGTLHMGLISSSITETFVPETGVLHLNFVFPRYDLVWEVLNDEKIRQALWSALEKKGFVGLGFGSTSPRGFQNKIRPVRVPVDAKGLKIRVMESPLYMEQMKAIGAIPTPLPFPEVYTALQHGLIDGTDVGNEFLPFSKFLEVEKHATFVDAIYHVMIMLINKDKFDKLSKEHQNALRAASKWHNAWTAKKYPEMRQEFIDKGAEKYGAKIVVPTDEEYDKWKEALLPVNQKYIEVVGKDIYDLFLKTAERLKKTN